MTFAEINSDLKINKIDRVVIHQVRLPLKQPFVTSFGIETHKDALLINIQAKDIQGWGESVTSPAPFYGYETNETAMWVLKNFLVPMIPSRKYFSLHDCLEKFKKIRGHPMAKAALENALLDLLARENDQPLYSLLGGKPKKIKSGISIGIQANIDALIQAIAQAQKKKYHRIKIKIKKNRDIQILEAVRKNFPDIKLMVDANGDYSIKDLDLLQQLDAFNLMMIEQPLEYDDIFFHSQLQRAIKTPVCLDESIKNLSDARIAHQLNSCQIINIKQGRVGGMLSARRIQDFCQENNIGCWSGGMLETGIGRAFNLHLQTLPGFTLPGDTSETSRYFPEDIVDKPVVLESNGYIDIPHGPGIGVEVVLKKLKKYTIFTEKL